jgi:putative ABC transport system ATP-binding protein
MDTNEPRNAATPIHAQCLYRARGLGKTYRMGEVDVHALRGVDLDLNAGQFCVILGASGSGKSTLLNLMGGLDRPSSGTIHYADTELGTLDDAELTSFRRNHIGFVFQFYNLIANLSATENIELVTDIASDPMPAEDALALVGLEKRAIHFPSQLSGGEQQRVAIARAIAKNPAVLLCDEPTGALDSATGIMVLQALQRANHTLGTTTIVITHNAAIAQMADQIIHMADGRIVTSETNPNPCPPDELSW